MARSRTGRGLRLGWLGLLAAVVTATGCATNGGSHQVHTMPADPALAMTPGEADPESAAELAEAALHLLNAERAGGPDYVGAARLCLLSAKAAVLPTERELQRSCLATAARSSLRAGNRDMYLEAVDCWEDVSHPHERAAGELSIHLSIRDELRGNPDGPNRAPGLRRLLAGDRRS